MKQVKQILQNIYEKSPTDIKKDVKQLAEILNQPLQEKTTDIIRIAHISDIHISERLTVAGVHIQDMQTGKSKKLVDIERCFLFVVSQAVKEKCNLAFITEPFDRANPTPNEINVFMKGIDILSKHMPVIIEPGNHGIDKNKKNDSIFNILNSYPNVKVVMSPTTFFFDGDILHDNIENIHDIGNGVFVHILPHASVFLTTNDKNEAKNIMLEHINRFRMYRNPSVLLGHLLVDTVLNPVAINRVKEPVFSIQDIDGFSYVGLGHIHRFLKLTDRMYYSGNIERIDFDEEHDSKGFIIADINIKTNELKVNFIKTPATELINLTIHDFMKLTENDINKNAVYRIIGEISVEQKADYIQQLTKMEKINPYIMSKVRIKNVAKKQDVNIFTDKSYNKIDDEMVILDYLQSNNIKDNHLINLIIKTHKEIQNNLRLN